MEAIDPTQAVHDPTASGWLEALSDTGGNPAAGSVAALGGAMSVALLIKLARLTLPDRVPGHAHLLSCLLAARDRLSALARADAAAVRTWLAHQQWDAADPRRQAAALQLVEIPLEVAELCRSIRRTAMPLVERGQSPAVADGQASLHLLDACCRIASDLARADLGLLTDARLRARMANRLAQLDEGT